MAQMYVVASARSRHHRCSTGGVVSNGVRAFARVGSRLGIVGVPLVKTGWLQSYLCYQIGLDDPTPVRVGQVPTTAAQNTHRFLPSVELSAAPVI